MRAFESYRAEGELSLRPAGLEDADIVGRRSRLQGANLRTVLDDAALDEQDSARARPRNAGPFQPSATLSVARALHGTRPPTPRYRPAPGRPLESMGGSVGGLDLRVP